MENSLKLFIILFNKIRNMTTYIDEVHITPDGGIIKKMIKKGEGECPQKG